VVYTLRGGRIVRSQRFISWHTALASVHDAADGGGGLRRKSGESSS
jgi:hypothetical protein